jgi:hypothetical protein
MCGEREYPFGLSARATSSAVRVRSLRAGDLLPRAATTAEKPLRLLLKFPASSPSSKPKKAASPPASAAQEYPPDLTLPDLKSGSLQHRRVPHVQLQGEALLGEPLVPAVNVLKSLLQFSDFLGPPTTTSQEAGLAEDVL